MSPSDLTPSYSGDQSAFNPNFTAQQRRQQRQQEIISEMEKAARNGDNELLSKIIEEGMMSPDNIESASRHHSESTDGSVQSSQSKLISRKDLNRALILAVQHCQATNKIQRVLDCINVLLSAGANANSSDPQQDGKTVLMIACERGFIEIVESLLFNEDCQINYKDSKQKTPLLYALDNQAENNDVISHLINNGADVNVVAHDGYSPLLKATQKQFHNIMQILLEHGANSAQKHLSTQNTALHLACDNGDLEAVKLLLKYSNCDLDALNRDKDTPIALTQKHQQSQKSQQHYRETYEYLRGVWEEKERRAREAKDELVKQEEIMLEERERKKQQRAGGGGGQKKEGTAGPGQKGLAVNKKNNNPSSLTVGGQSSQPHQQALVDVDVQKQQDIEISHQSQEQLQSEEKKQEPGEEAKITSSTAQVAQDEDFNFQNDNPANNSEQQQLQEIMMNPLSNAIHGHSPIMAYTQVNQPIQQQQQPADPYYQRERGGAMGLQSTPQGKNYNKQQQYTQLQQQQSNSSGKKPLNNGATNAGYVQSQQYAQQPQMQNNNYNQRQGGGGGQNRQQQQQTYDNTSYANMGAGSTTNNNNGGQQQRRQSGNSSNNINGSYNQGTNQNAVNKGNKSLPFITNPAAPQDTSNQGLNNRNNLSAQMASMPSQQPQIIMPNQIPAAGNIQMNQQVQTSMLGIQQQLNKPLNVVQPQILNQTMTTAMIQQVSNNHNAMQNNYFQHIPTVAPQFLQIPQQLTNLFQATYQQQTQAQLQPQQQQFLISHMFNALSPQQQQRPSQPPQNSVQVPTTTTIQQQQPQPSSQQQQQQQQQQQPQPSQQQPATSTNTPIMDELDLSDPQALKIFLQEQQLYKMQKQIDQRDLQLQIKQFEVDNKCNEINALSQNLSKQDSEIEIHVKNLESLQQRIQQQEAHIILQQNEHKEKINELSLDHQYNMDKLKNHCLEVERLLMKIHTVHKQTADKIVKCYEEKRLFSEEEIKEVEKNISGHQMSLNQLILTHKPDYNSQQYQPYSKQQQQQIPQQKPQQTVSTLSTNKLVHMMERFEYQVPTLPNQSHGSIMLMQQDMQVQDQNDVYNKLHLEILQFRDSVKEILTEMQPVKEQIIENITAVIKKAVPQSEVRVYGSHATKLCLPWSDIDLVIITPSRFNEHMNVYNPKSVLSQISQELRNEISNKWVSQVNFVNNATVPVVKVNCHIKDLMIHSNNKQLSQQDFEKYKVFLDQPFNIDITQMTDHHNGLECVSVVQEYLAENEIIEPLILVLKQLLKVCSLNNPYFGGLSSYALFLMIVSYLQSHEPAKEIAKVNLGKVLINFLGFYGSFDHENIGVSCHLPVKRQGQQMDLKPNQYPLLSFVIMPSPCIQIDDPLNPSNNVGKSSFKFFEIKIAFDYSQRVFFLGCFCDCHITQIGMHDVHQHSFTKSDSNTTFTMHGGPKDIVSHKRQCDSVLSRIIYSYKMFEQFFGPFHPMG